MYKLVMFKSVTDTSEALKPAIPKEFDSLAVGGAYSICDKEYSYVFVIVEETTNEEELKQLPFFIGLTKEEEEKYDATIKNVRLEVEYMNGTKERPVSEVMNGLG